MSKRKLDTSSVSAILANVLQQVHFSKEEQDFFVSLLYERHFEKKEPILGINEICQYQNFVVKGCLKVFYLDGEGVEHIAKFAIENWWAYDIESFFTVTPSFYGIAALEKTVVLQLSKSNHVELMNTIPAFERFYRIMLQNSFIALQHRMTQSLSLTAHDRYLRFQQKYPGLENRISQKDIAAYLGITPVFLSMLRKQNLMKN